MDSLKSSMVVLHGMTVKRHKLQCAQNHNHMVWIGDLCFTLPEKGSQSLESWQRQRTGQRWELAGLLYYKLKTREEICKEICENQEPLKWLLLTSSLF